MYLYGVFVPNINDIDRIIHEAKNHLNEMNYNFDIISFFITNRKLKADKKKSIIQSHRWIYDIVSLYELEGLKIDLFEVKNSLNFLYLPSEDWGL